MNILCHVGPWCIEQYREIAKNVESSAKIDMISGFKNVDKTGFVNHYYSLLKQREPVNDSSISQEIADDIIARCRLLRSLDKKIAMQHIYCAHVAIAKVFENTKPDIVISETIDQYLIDLIHFECHRLNIPFVGIVISFINGYYRISAKGELNKYRTPSNEEVDRTIRLLSESSYKPSFITKSSSSHIKSAMIRWLKNTLRIPYFIVKRRLSGETYNYHYWASSVSALNDFHIVPRIFLGNDKWKAYISNSQKKTIYIPLQMFPEATIEYWCRNLEAIRYQDSLIDLVEKLSKSYNIIIKEHPNVIGLRSPNLYDKLLKFKNVYFASMHVDSNYLIDLSDAILVWTGTAGFEAALRGKPVLTVDMPYYAIGPKFKTISKHTPETDIDRFLKEQSGELTYAEKYALVSNLLSGLMPGKYINDSSWNPNNPDDLNDSANIGKQIRKYVCRL